eukprot:107866-Amphidinium_carterae.1
MVEERGGLEGVSCLCARAGCCETVINPLLKPPLNLQTLQPKLTKLTLSVKAVENKGGGKEARRQTL